MALSRDLYRVLRRVGSRHIEAGVLEEQANHFGDIRYVIYDQNGLAVRPCASSRSRRLFRERSFRVWLSESAGIKRDRRLDCDAGIVRNYESIKRLVCLRRLGHLPKWRGLNGPNNATGERFHRVFRAD